MSCLYRFRRWLVMKLVPKNLKVFAFHGMETAPGTSVFDPENRLPWLTVNIEYWSEFTEYIEDDGTTGYRSHRVR